MKWIGSLCLLLILGCHTKPNLEVVTESYQQPDGPTSGEVKILYHVDSDSKDGAAFVWYEFLSNHQVKEYEDCNDSDKVITEMVGNISLRWDANRGCFMIVNFYREERLEEENNIGKE